LVVVVVDVVVEPTGWPDGLRAPVVVVGGTVVVGTELPGEHQWSLWPQPQPSPSKGPPCPGQPQPGPEAGVVDVVVTTGAVVVTDLVVVVTGAVVVTGLVVVVTSAVVVTGLVIVVTTGTEVVATGVDVLLAVGGP
jgi:hypothetical protein